MFGQSQSAEYCMRFNVAQAIDRHIFEVLSQALAVSKLNDDVVWKPLYYRFLFIIWSHSKLIYVVCTSYHINNKTLDSS